MGICLKPYTYHMTIQNMIFKDKEILALWTAKNLGSQNQYGKEDELCGTEKINTPIMKSKLNQQPQKQTKLLHTQMS